MSLRFAVVGPGKVGSALAKLLAGAGYAFLGCAGRSLESARRACELVGSGRATTDAAGLTRGAELVFITTPDDVIAQVCRELAGRGAFRTGATVAHCCGALPSTILEPARACGARLGSIHPLQSFATVEQAVELMPGSFCCVEGDPEAVEVLRAVAGALGARVVNIPTESKPLYHAAAVMASNFLVALENAAVKLGEAAGIGRREALESLLPLIRGTVSNMEKVGIPQCLTGPISRGDVETTRRHLEAIRRRAPALLSLYRVLALEAVEIGLAKGTLSLARATELRTLLAS